MGNDAGFGNQAVASFGLRAPLSRRFLPIHPHTALTLLDWLLERIPGNVSEGRETSEVTRAVVPPPSAAFPEQPLGVLQGEVQKLLECCRGLADPGWQEWVDEVLMDGAAMTPPQLIDRLLHAWTESPSAADASRPSRSGDAGPSASDCDHRRLDHVLRLIRYLRAEEARFEARLAEEKMAALKELAYGASHEINNPLANISSRAQLLLREETDAERRRSLATINRQAFRAHEMIADMMLFAKPPALKPAKVDWHTWVDELADTLERDTPGRLAYVRSDDVAGHSLEVAVDPVQMVVAVTAIYQNALEAMGDEGVVQLAARVFELGDGRAGALPHEVWGELEIRDSGPGIRAEIRRHLFDPFFSGREAGRGLGFGLSKAWRIVERHGGQILVDSPAGEGAVIWIRLPAVS